MLTWSYRLEHNIEFSALSEKGKKYFNLEAYAQELEETERYAVSENGIFKLQGQCVCEISGQQIENDANFTV